VNFSYGTDRDGWSDISPTTLLNTVQAPILNWRTGPNSLLLDPDRSSPNRGSAPAVIKGRLLSRFDSFSSPAMPRSVASRASSVASKLSDTLRKVKKKAGKAISKAASAIGQSCVARIL
jgi:hypothetical protein